MKKKKNKRNRSIRGRNAHTSMLPVNRRIISRAAEAVLWAIEHKTKGQVFESLEEANAFLSRLIESQDLELEYETPLEKAQAIMYTAFEQISRAERIRLAKKALTICEDCADAYVLLAEETESIEEKKRLYELGVQAGERTLGSLLQEEKGHLWGIVRTRPYLRARMGLADTLAMQMDWEAAGRHYASLLELNRGDNQGARFQLLLCYVHMEKYDEALNLIKQYGDDDCDFAYTKAFIWFLKRGDVYLTRRYLDAAFEVNQYVPFMLWDPEAVEEQVRKIAYTPVGVDDAQRYVDRYSIIWAQHPDAYNWVVERCVYRLTDTHTDLGPNLTLLDISRLKDE